MMMILKDFTNMKSVIKKFAMGKVQLILADCEKLVEQEIINLCQTQIELTKLQLEQERLQNQQSQIQIPPK